VGFKRVRHEFRQPHLYPGKSAMSSIDSLRGEARSIPSLAVLALSLAAFASGASIRVTDPMLPRLSADFGVSLGDAAGVVTIFSAAVGLTQLFFGPVGDRFGKYLVIAWACVACALTAMLCALAPRFHWLLAARLLAGASAGAIIPLSMAWIGDVVPYESRQPVLARFLIGQILGFSAGQLAGGFAAEYLTWRLPFIGLALCFAAVSILLFTLNRRLPVHARTVHKATGNALKRTVAEFGQVLTSAWARVVLVTVFFEGVFLFGAFAFIASHLHREHGLSLSAAGALVMLFGMGGLAFAASSRLLVKRLGEVGLARWGGSLLFLSMLVTGVGGHWWWAVPGCFLAGLGFYMFHNTLQTHATQMAPERRGAAVSSFAFCYFFGQSAGVALAGLLVESAGTGPVIALGAVGTLAVALNFGRLRSARHS
jgi:predicted MFS family arabinose efflux permease